GPAAGGSSLPYFFPRPLYEYEVLVYNSAPGRKEVADLFSSSIKTATFGGKTSESMLEPLATWSTLPAIRIAYIGVPSGLKTLVLAGLPSLKLSDAHEGVSIFEAYRGRDTFTIPDLAKLIESFQKD